MNRLLMAMTPDRAADVCDPGTRALLDSAFETTWATSHLDLAELSASLPGHDVVVPSWGTPHLPSELLGGGLGPTVVAHAAGTIKSLLDPSALDRGLTVFSGASRIAWSVGEYCLGACLSLMRGLPRYDAAVRAGDWRPDGLRGRELRAARVGIVGASATARAFLTQLAPFGVDAVVYDPYLDADRAAELGVRVGSLAEVMGADVVSVHVPNVPATEGMITAELIDTIADGAVVINSSRATAVDTDALLAAALSGRIAVALDVFSEEPARLDPRVLRSPHVLLSPHIAGDSVEGHRALTGYVLSDVLAWLERSHRGPSWVDPSVWSIAA